MIGGPNVYTLIKGELLGRMLSSSVKDPGLGDIFETLLGFEGDEFYTEKVSLFFLSLSPSLPPLCTHTHTPPLP